VTKSDLVCFSGGLFRLSHLFAALCSKALRSERAILYLVRHFAAYPLRRILDVFIDQPLQAGTRTGLIRLNNISPYVELPAD
jgi:hypothetical protein